MLGRITFDEIFKGNFIDQFTTNQLAAGDAIIAMLFSVAVGFVIFFVYKITYKGVVYSHSFNTSLIMMCAITTAIIITISSNIVLSLGMVGALSIVRFRTAIKDPVDIMYLFWAVSAGIIVGAKQYIFAVVATVVITLIMIIMNILRGKHEIFLVIVRVDPSHTEKIERAIKNMNATLKNKSFNQGMVEFVFETRSKEKGSKFVNNLMGVNGVESVSMVNYNGDYASN